MNRVVGSRGGWVWVVGMVGSRGCRAVGVKGWWGGGGLGMIGDEEVKGSGVVRIRGCKGSRGGGGSDPAT